MSYYQTTAFNPYLQYSMYPMYNWGYNQPMFMGLPNNTALPLVQQQAQQPQINTTNLDSVTFSANKEIQQQTKEGLSTGAKWAIGIGATTALAVGADFLFCKGKHVKSLLGKSSKNNGSKGGSPSSSKPTVKTSTGKTELHSHTKLPEGMLPEEISKYDIPDMVSKRYLKMRFGETKYPKKVNLNLESDFNRIIASESKNIRKEVSDYWVYRVPNSIKDRITDFKIIPNERVSMNVNPEPKLIEALDRYLTTGEVIKGGKLLRTVTPPKAYYKSCQNMKAFTTRQDPITMYFREPATKEQIADIIEITSSFQAPHAVKFPRGSVDGAHWLSHGKEFSPEETYQLYKKAMNIDTKLGEGVGYFCKNQGVSISSIDYGKGLPLMERKRYRISEGQYLALESFINDYAKAVGKAV